MECYLCLDGGDDDKAGQPLRRDCACRGTQMPDLLTSPASLHSQSPRVSRRVVWMNSGIRGENVPAATNTTKTSLQSILRQSLFRSLCQVDSLQVKLRALNSMIDKLQSVQKREAGVTATVLLSLIDRIKSESPPLHMRYSQFQAFAYSTHGLIALDEGNTREC